MKENEGRGFYFCFSDLKSLRRGLSTATSSVCLRPPDDLLRTACMYGFYVYIGEGVSGRLGHHHAKLCVRGSCLFVRR